MKRKKIAVLRANALGDFIFVLPALHMLRRIFPDAEIFYLGKSMHQILLSGRAGPVDHVVVIPPYPGVGEAEDFQPDQKEVDTFFDRMRAEKFDLALQLHGGGRYSNPFVLRLGAAFTVGLGTPDAAQLDITIPYVTFFHETLRYIEVVSYLDMYSPGEPYIIVTEQDVAEANAVMINRTLPFAFIHPGASDRRRRWPVEKFARVADFLIEQGWCIYISTAQKMNQILPIILFFICVGNTMSGILVVKFH
jgi:ADP-heptose:LPS heptosyltransferase